MTRIRRFATYRLPAPWALAVLAAVSLTQVDTRAQTARPRRIAVFGSSVANGTGDEFHKEGYTGLLRQMMAPRGWDVLNQSRGGDTTKRMAPRFEPPGTPDPNVRYLVPVNPGYVVIGLSLANEGIWEAKTKEEKDAVFKQYADGIKGFIDRSRQNNIVPVVALVYPRLVYTPVEYEYVRRMNLLQNSWDVPSINFLGALDDGAGRWATGFGFDDKHPNASGHREFLYAFVPTLFEALEKGKPTPTRPANAKGFARIAGDRVTGAPNAAAALGPPGAAGPSQGSPLVFTPQDTLHPFAVSFMVRSPGDGTVAAVSGSTLAAKSEMKKVEPQGASSVEFQSITLSPERMFTATVGVQNGKWTYRSANGTSVGSSVNADAQWHHIVLSHYTARGETLFFVDGKLSGRIAERLEPNRFVLGGPGSPEGASAPKQADYKDLFIFRSAVNPEEAAAMNQGKLLQASLEVYAPLTDAQFRPDSPVENRAQSMSVVKPGSARITHVEDSASQTQ